jgi:hypothetical protein
MPMERRRTAIRETDPRVGKTTLMRAKGALRSGAMGRERRWVTWCVATLAVTAWIAVYAAGGHVAAFAILAAALVVGRVFELVPSLKRPGRRHRP